MQAEHKILHKWTTGNKKFSKLLHKVNELQEWIWCQVRSARNVHKEICFHGLTPAALKGQLTFPRSCVGNTAAMFTEIVWGPRRLCIQCTELFSGRRGGWPWTLDGWCDKTQKSNFDFVQTDIRLKLSDAHVSDEVNYFALIWTCGGVDDDIKKCIGWTLNLFMLN